ncbi:MAG: alginate O-acetyltransferase complex protein AlgI, partial [Planctomycetota bacterium]
MYFNSVEFFVFFPIVYGLFWASRNNQRLRNWILLLASYLFYGWWDWRFLSLIWISTCVDFVCARKISESGARFWLLLSIATNLGFLATFKYLDFFVGSFSALATSLGFELSAPTLGIVLPVGISFYTFQTMGYTIDVYRKRQRATDDLLTFAVYVAYFPQLVAGPIERASRLLPALSKRPVFSLSNIQSGLWLAYFGLFKKVAVADATAPIVESVFSKGGDVT